MDEICISIRMHFYALYLCIFIICPVLVSLLKVRPVKSHAIGVSVTHSSTTSRSHAKKEKSHATFQICCLFSHANNKN